MNIEEFVNNYLQEHRHDVLFNLYNGLVEFAEALKAEALKEAVEGYVDQDFIVTESPFYLFRSVNLDLPSGFNEGDNVKLIVVKKD